MDVLKKELEAVDVAVLHAINLVNKFAEQDPHDASSCWQNPTRMCEQLDRARTDAMAAYKALEDAKAAARTETNHQGGAVWEEEDLRAQFMDMVTDAFADVLEEMKDKESIDVDILVDCLQSGMEILSHEDKEFLMGDFEQDIPPHEERRRKLGYHHVETTNA